MTARIRHEILSLITVISLPLAIAIVFPYSSIGFRAEKKNVNEKAFAAFITLSLEEEQAALKSARASWRVNASDIRNAELHIDELPERTISAVLDFKDRDHSSKQEKISYGLPPYIPSCASPDAKLIVPDEKPQKVLPFSRSALLFDIIREK